MVASSPPPAPDPQAQYALELARSAQNLPQALLAGAAAASASAVLWGVITALTGYQIGFMAVGVGVAVGFAVRAAGHGVDTSFRVLASILAVIGCAAGNLLAGCAFFAAANEVGVERVLQALDLDMAANLMQAMFSPMDVLFYGLAILEAWRRSVFIPPATPTAS
jgi:hypothetical protein